MYIPVGGWNQRMKKKLSKKNITLMLLAFLAAVLCIVMPEQVMAIHKKNTAGVCMDVPEEYYPTSSYYEVIKASSEKLSEYQKHQLITGMWNSEISEVDKSYYEDTGYHMEAQVRDIVKKAVVKELYPAEISSSYSDWYNWKATYMQALDMTFRSYAGFFWRVEFDHYKDVDKFIAYITPEGRVIEIDYVIEDYEKKSALYFWENMDHVQKRRLASILLGEKCIVSDVNDATQEDETKVMQFIQSDRYQEMPKEINDTDISLTVTKIDVRETENGSGKMVYYFYIYNTNDRVVVGFIPVD